jgi:hypothetical protein
MRDLICLALFTVVMGASTVAFGAEQCLYVAAGGKVTVFRINDSDGKLSPLQEMDLLGAGPLGVSAGNRYLYAVAGLPGERKRRPKPAIATF